MNEKRRYPRYNVQLPAFFKSQDPQSMFQTMTILNISADGLCFNSPVMLARGTQLKLEISLSPKELIRLDVEVMWSEQESPLKLYKCGVYITETSSFDEERFIQYYCQNMLNAIRSKRAEKSDPPFPT